MTCSRERLCASSRASSSSSTAAASDAALPSLVVRVRQRDPPDPSRPCSAAERTGFARNATVTMKLLSKRWTRARSTTQCGSSSERGWVVVDVLPRSTLRVARVVGGRRGGTPGIVRRAPAPRADRRAARSCVAARTSWRCTRGCGTCCRTGPMLDAAGALLGEPAVLYKEKINYKLPGGAGYSAAPGRARVPDDRRPRVGDGGDRRRRRRQRRPRGGLRLLRRGAADGRAGLHRAGRSTHRSTGSRSTCPRAPRCGSTAARRTAAEPNLSSRPRRALYPTYNAAREGDRRAEYYAAKAAAFAASEPGDRALVSLIGDFEGRPA